MEYPGTSAGRPARSPEAGGSGNFVLVVGLEGSPGRTAFLASVSDASSRVMQVFDKDLIRDDPLGSGVVELADLVQGKATPKTLGLKKKGQLYLELVAENFGHPPHSKVRADPLLLTHVVSPSLRRSARVAQPSCT